MLLGGGFLPPWKWKLFATSVSDILVAVGKQQHFILGHQQEWSGYMGRNGASGACLTSDVAQRAGAGRNGLHGHDTDPEDLKSGKREIPGESTCVCPLGHVCKVLSCKNPAKSRTENQGIRDPISKGDSALAVLPSKE